MGLCQPAPHGSWAPLPRRSAHSLKQGSGLMPAADTASTTTWTTTPRKLRSRMPLPSARRQHASQGTRVQRHGNERGNEPLNEPLNDSATIRQRLTQRISTPYPIPYPLTLRKNLSVLSPLGGLRPRQRSPNGLREGSFGRSRTNSGQGLRPRMPTSRTSRKSSRKHSTTRLHGSART